MNRQKYVLMAIIFIIGSPLSSQWVYTGENGNKDK
jgi:hypothetical protein